MTNKVRLLYNFVMKITTKTGDDGSSALFSGKRLLKNSKVFDVLGNLDELNSFLGFVKVEFKKINNLEKIILTERLQDDVYRIMSIVGFEMKAPKEIKMINEEDVMFLEDEMEKFKSITQGLSKFVKPGESEISARLHLCRSVCRRAERSFVDYSENFESDSVILKYLNRLSDLLFVLSLA